MIGAVIPILMYHEVSPRPHPAFRRYTVTVRAFARQMRWLAALGYRTIDMDGLVAARTGRARLPQRPVVITFDDGFRDSAEHAVPVLRAHGFTAVFYLVAGWVGKTSRWMASDPGVELPLMSWETARGLIAGGFQCGAHSVTHRRLAGLPQAECRKELVEGRKRLEDGLGRSVTHLAYPFGSYDRAVEDLVAEAGYTTGCSTRPGLSGPEDDLLALHRVTVYGHDSLPDFVSRVRSGAAVRERLGRAVAGLARPFQRGDRS